jgi:glucuronokinase
LLYFSRQQFKEIYIVTNADKYKHYERWATANEFPVANIINDGSTSIDNSLGAIADLELAIRSKNITDDILVVSGDMLFDENFNIQQLLDYFKNKRGDLAIYYELEEDVSTEERGMVEIDTASGRLAREDHPLGYLWIGLSSSLKSPNLTKHHHV